MYPLNEKIFLVLLAGTLFLAGLIGGILGLLSGIVGIVGGIFLAPVMLNMKWGKPKEVAATASAFIWLNSLAGLVGQMTKGFNPLETFSYWPLFLAVILGGQIGSRIGTHPRISQHTIQKGTALLILGIAIRRLNHQ